MEPAAEPQEFSGQPSVGEKKFVPILPEFYKQELSTDAVSHKSLAWLGMLCLSVTSMVLVIFAVAYLARTMLKPRTRKQQNLQPGRLGDIKLLLGENGFENKIDLY